MRLCAVGQRYSVCESYVIKYISVSFESFDVGRRDRAARPEVARRLPGLPPPRHNPQSHNAHSHAHSAHARSSPSLRADNKP